MSVDPKHLAPEHMSDLAAARSAHLEGRDDAGGTGAVRPVVLESWRRSRGHGVDPRRLPVQSPDPDRLQRARERSKDLLAAAEPFLELVHDTLADERHLVALADAEGLILRLLTGPGLDPRELQATNLVEGVSWHERDIGSNGVGTCLAAGEPVILIGPEHFQESYLGWTCIGVPIRDTGGQIVGALDLSVPNEDAHVHGWGWTLTLARGIEAALRAPAPAGPAKLRRVEEAAEEPLESIGAVFDLLATKLDIAPTHARFLDEARAELEAAESRSEALITQLDTANRERSRAESALGHDREFLERLVESIPVMVAVYDPAIQEVRLNRHVEEVLGWTNEDLEDANIMELCYPDPALREEVSRFMQSLEPGWREFEMVAKDGSVVLTQWANVRLTDERQVGIGIDVTERKKAERERERAYDQARNALEEHDNVLAVVSHDLRSPLNTLSMASSLLLEDIPQEKKEEQVAIIGRSIDHMRRLIEDLLDAARIHGGGLRIQRKPCRLGDLVRRSVESMRPLAESRSMELRGADGVDVVVDADRNRIHQVLVNLIGNGIKHTRGPGTITVHVEADGGAEVRVGVQDTGEGIATEDLDHVFDRYWQVGKPTDGGAGLGLAIAKGVVEAHDGRIWAESEPGQGSTFWFTLPVTDGPPPDAAGSADD